LHAAGLDTVAVDVRGMIESLEKLQGQMQMLLTPPQVAMG